MTSPHILLIDDHPMFRAGLSLVLNRELPDVRIFQAASVNEALNTSHEAVQLVLLDIKLNGSSGLEGIGVIKRQWPAVPILMLSSHDEPETTRLALVRGATAFMSKAEAPETIIDTITQLLRGELPQAKPVASPSDKRLTPRQREVLELLHQGLTNKVIARKLTLSDNTVRRHMQEILKYFEVATRAEAVFAARQQALVG
jgi:DNA-binding NarL/FixJ family response regulator